MSDHAGHPYKGYWLTWAVLLVITMLMLAAEALHLPRWFLIVFLVAFMLVKAGMISGTFMHLRQEHRRMAVMVAAGILVTSLVLYAFITPESWHVRERSAFQAEQAGSSHAADQRAPQPAGP